jgi:hypothetical protein
VLALGLNKDENLIKHYQNKSQHYKNIKDIVSKNWINWNDLVNYTHNIKNNLKFCSDDKMEKQYQYFMVAVMYTYTVPLRNQEYRLVVLDNKIFESKNIKKLIEDGNDHIINQIWINAEHELRNYIIYLKKINKWINGGYLFYQENMNHCMTEQIYINNIKKVFKGTGKELTIRIIRKSYETHLQNSEEYKAMTLEEKTAKHKEALHDYETAMEYRKDD